MRKKIEFKHAWEIVKWCEENREIPILVGGVKIIWKGENLKFIKSNGKEKYLKITDAWIQKNTFYIEVDWRDTLKEKPVLCWVWNFNSTNKKEAPKVISCFREQNANPYISYESAYFKAEPLTQEEANQYIFEAE